MLILVNKFVKWKSHYYSGDVTAIALTPDNKYMISGSQDQSIKVFDLTTKKQIDHFHAHNGK